MAEEKHFERRLTLIQRVETITSVIELLLETLADLSESEVKEFKKVFQSYSSYRRWEYDIQWGKSKITDMQKTVLFMAQTSGERSVEKTQNFLMKMNRMDLVQRLTGSSSGAKEKLSVDEHFSALIHKIATEMAVRELLIETLNDLSDQELKKFKWLLQFTHFMKGCRSIPWIQLKSADRAEVVRLVMERCGKQSVEVIREVFMDMNKTDLVQRLSETSSAHKEKQSVDEQWPALIQKVETLTSVIKLLLETLADLSDVELNEFKDVLQSQTYFYEPDFKMMADIQEVVFFMVQIFRQKSVEKTEAILNQINRTDLVQKLSESSVGAKKKHLVDEQLIQKVATIAAVKEMLLEIVNLLSYQDLKKFNEILQFKSAFTNTADTVDEMLQRCGQQSVKKTMEIFKKINRSDLIEKLSGTRSEHKAVGETGKSASAESQSTEKQSVDEQRPALIQKAVTNMAERELLLQTLNDLSGQELKTMKWLLQFTLFKKGRPSIPWYQLEWADRTAVVELVMESCGQQSVEVIREVFMDMNKTDLVQRLPETSSGHKAAGSSVEVFGVKTAEGEKLSLVEQWPALIQKVETMKSVIELILETLDDLSDRELVTFREVLQRHFTIQLSHFRRRHHYIHWWLMEARDMQETVLFMVHVYGKQFMEMTRKVLEDMGRSDLVQRPRDYSAGPKKKHLVDEQLVQKVATMAAVEEMLLETVNDLSDQEFKEFQDVLEMTAMRENIPYITSMFSNRVETVDEMLQNYGQQSVELMKKIFKKMNRSDLIQRFSDTSSECKELSRSLEFGAYGGITEDIKEKLLETLRVLSFEEIEHFKRLLQTLQIKHLPRIRRVRIERADRVDLAELMVKIYGQQSVEVTREVLKMMNRMDLVHRLSDTSSASKEGSLRSAESEADEDIMVSSDWIKCDPEVNSTDTDENPTYCLQSEAGKFECSVSDLRWVCEGKVSFKYQFCSWEGHMERMEILQYMPAGPLMDITVTAGKLNEVYLPHWICTDDNPEILDKFSVLHIDACGDVVEHATEVTSSHVKLSEPVFSPRAVLMKVGFPVKINCNVLIYKTNTAFLTLHVYLIPRDPGLGQVMDKRETSYGYRVIRKPHPERSLKMRDRFILTTDLDSAEIYPEKLKLRYESRNPNFFEVFVENPNRNFQLRLSLENELEPVWTCAIRKEEYKSTGHIQEEHTVDELSALVQQAATITAVGEKLFEKLQRLEEEDFKDFKWFLQKRSLIPADLPCIAWSKLEKADMKRVVDLMEQTYNQRAVEVTKMLFKKINRNDLVKQL